MRPGRIALLIGILLAIAASAGTTVVIRRRLSSEPPPAPRPPDVAVEPLVLPAVVPPPVPPPAAEEGVPVEPPRTGWLKARLDPAPALDFYTFHVEVYGPRRQRELAEDFDNVNRFDLGPLAPGPKVIFLHSPESPLGSVLAQATVEDGKETEVILHSQVLVAAKGTVVDASGAAVPGISVEIEEFFPVDLGKLKPASEEFGGMTVGTGVAGGRYGGRVSSGRAGFRGSSSGYGYCFLTNGIHLTYDSGTDGDGHFYLWRRPDAAVVTVTLRRGTEKILQESIVPSTAPLRLVIPLLPDPEKK